MLKQKFLYRIKDKSTNTQSSTGMKAPQTDNTDTSSNLETRVVDPDSVTLWIWIRIGNPEARK
jgi:hypothetical protein